MVKKVLKIIGSTLVVIVLLLVAIPYFFKDQIKAKITAAINEKMDAKISFADADLSLFRSFPQANVTIDKLVIINKAPFEGDTLILMGQMNLKMSVKELFKGKEEAMDIEAIATENGIVNIIFNKDGIGNFDIALKDEKDKSDTKSSPLSLKIKEYKVTNLKFSYRDEKSKIRMELDSLNHSGTGDFAASKLDLVTKSSAKVSLFMDKVNYMNRVALNLDAVLGIDLEKSKYTFKENKARINQLPIEFDGFIQMVPEGQNYDLKFKTPTASFENFLGLLPAAYSASLNGVKTTGNFTIVGFAKGQLSKTTVPKFNLAIASNNASFHYPNLPKSVENITIDTKIINETGLLNDTYVNVDQLSFKIDKDVFTAKATIKNVAENPLVTAEFSGIVNLSNVSKAYPVKLKMPLSGLLSANVKTKFDMKAVATNQYEKMQNSGNISVTDFKYAAAANKIMTINKATVQFTNTQINLQELDLTTGKSDIRVQGVLENFYGFMLKSQELKGNFNVASNQFAVSDFMTSEKPTATETKTPREAVKIPSFLNCAITAKVNTVLYDNLVLKNVSGKMTIYDQKVALDNIKSSVFDGQIDASGSVATKGKTPLFAMKLVMSGVDVQQTFTQLEMMKKIAPIEGVVNGKLNATINLSGSLNDKEMTPNLNTVSGDFIGQLSGATINAQNAPMLNKLGDNIRFIDLKKINLNDVKIGLTFNDGKVNIKPFDLKYQDIKVNVGGQHGFDQNMNYNVKLDVPAKYLGSDANALLSKLGTNEANKLQNIPVNAIVTGTFKNPKVTTDMKSAVANLATQLLKQQKDKLLHQGATVLGNLLNSANKKDTTKTQIKEDIKAKAGALLNGFFGQKK